MALVFKPELILQTNENNDVEKAYICKFAFYVSTPNLVSWTESMHGTDLMRGQRFAKKVDGRHLTTKYSLFIQIWCSSDVTFVKGL